MKLLICTQVVDSQHPVLGFFHRWLEEFAKHCDRVNVVCLEEGEHNLPDNVNVYSLGKEQGRSRIKYIYRFYKYIWKLRKEYTHVFVHMNEEFAILGSPLWRLFGKKIGHWRMHGEIDWRLYVSRAFVHTIFTGADTSYPLKSKKLHIVGHGIDIERFVKFEDRKEYDVVTVGRISRSKNIDNVIDMFALVRKKMDVKLTIVGKPITDDDKTYLKSLESKVEQLELGPYIQFYGAIENSDLPKFLSKSKVFIHLATSGSYDKVLLESMAVGLPVVTSAWGARTLPLGSWYVDSVQSAADMVCSILDSNNDEKLSELRMYVENEHNLSTLVPKIISLY